MNKKLALLIERRQQLILQATEQRIVLAQDIQPLRSSIALADIAIVAVRYVKQHPILMLGGASLLGMLKPTHWGKWLHRGWIVLEITRKLRGWLSNR